MKNKLIEMMTPSKYCNMIKTIQCIEISAMSETTFVGVTIHPIKNPSALPHTLFDGTGVNTGDHEEMLVRRWIP